MPADLTILAVLAKASCALKIAEIVREAAKARQEMRKAKQETRLVLVSEDVLAERLPLLLNAGLVAPPQGVDGKPKQRKGVGITSQGRQFLKGTGGEIPA